MASFISKMLLKSSYKSVYGNNAIINIGEGTVEVVIGNRVIIHDKTTTDKLEEKFWENGTLRVVKYDNGKAVLEETFEGETKISEKVLGDGKSTNVSVENSGMETSTSTYVKDNIEYKEVTYKFHNKLTETDYTVITIESENEILRNIVKKKGEEILIDIQKKLHIDGRIAFYKFNDLEVEVEYFGDSKTVNRYSKHWEEPIFEESTASTAKNKKPSKDVKEVAKKQIGTKIRKEILEYNKKGNILHLETDNECIHREFDDEFNLKKQYNIIEGEFGKEIVGKIITDDKDIKIINNSTLSNDKIVKLNEEMDILEYRYEDNLIMMYDFMFWDGGIEITEEYYQINNRLDFKKRSYDKLENNVDYHIEETYKNNKLYATRMINKLSKTELYAEGNRRFVKGLSGVEKEVSEEEFELYKMADALNKI